ncbi:MAG: YggS family pyridoxal phosphate-dependent enzyme [Candidatus Zipacnadales bacterium]
MINIASRLADVRRRIDEAARRAGRDPAEIQLVAVGKTKPVADLREAIEAGVTALGENYVQELLRKREEIGDVVQWHFIGHLQTNKVKYLVPFCALIHGVDSWRLAEAIDQRARLIGRRQPVLLEVKLSGEDTKFGVQEAEVGVLARQVLELPAVELRGLMVMPPFFDDPEATRPYFVRLRQVRDNLVREGVPYESLRELSMGMTADFEIAIEEGATIIRVGTAIFGPRSSTKT